MKKILIPAALLFINFISGQQPATKANLPNIVPPSPTAYALGNYGNVPVGLFTGTANISVPLFTYKTNNISLPLNLFYGSNGIKIDEVSSNVGLGWNLNFGGVITRMVRDRADETSTHINVPDNVSGAYSNPVTNKFFYAIGNGSEALDTEADLYSFNFNGNSGKFFYDQNGQPHIVDQQALKIERIGSTSGDGQDFLLTTATGEKYYFTEKERTVYRSVGSGHSLPSSAITSWYLTKIVHPNGDEISFTYQSSSLSEYVGSKSQTLRMSVGYPSPQASCLGGSGYTLAPSLGEISDNTIEVMGKNILSISSNNPDSGTVTFEYEPDNTANLDIAGNKKIKVIRLLNSTGNIIESSTFNYINTSNKRNFLSSIVFKDTTRSYTFDYESPEGFPERLSYSQDKWGYYNGKINNNLIPANVTDYDLIKYNYYGANKEPDPAFSKIGMLKRIQYPTKGYTDLEYEGNTYWGEKTIYPALVSKQLQTKTDNVTDENTTEFTFTSAVTQTIVINATLSGNSITACNSFVSSGHYAGSISINQGVPYALTRDNNTKQIVIEAIAGATYTITLRADFMCSNVRANFSYYPTAPQTFETNIDTGGVRIKSTKDIDGSTGQPVYKRYYYAHKDDLTHSSGLKGNNPYYTDIDKWQTVCTPADGLTACSFVENSNVVLSSGSIIPLYDTGTMSSVYPFVTISEGGDNFENGGEMKTFKVRKDDPGSNVWGTGRLNSNPWTNKGWDNGSELKSTVLKKNAPSSALDIVQEKENIYEKNDQQTFELKNFAGRMLFNMACPADHPYICTATDVSIPNTACTGKAAGTQVYLSNIDNLNISEYRLVSYLHYLKSQKTTDYLNGTPVASNTEYFYNNPSHYQLTQQKNTFPDGTVNEITYSYAHEKGNQLMIDKNMIGIPLETKTQQTIGNNTKVTSREETIYPTALPHAVTGNLVLPLSEYSYDTLSPAVSSKEVTYEKYDEKGNILQYREKDGTPVSIVWGYNKTKPIAKVVGSTYSQIEGMISTIVTKSNEDAADPTKEAELLQALDAFQPAGMVTTYTYDPLVGVTTITPPSGIRELYVYDTANRLKQVQVRERDNTGTYSYKVVKEFKYNYKQ